MCVQCVPMTTYDNWPTAGLLLVFCCCYLCKLSHFIFLLNGFYFELVIYCNDDANLCLFQDIVVHSFLFCSRVCLAQQRHRLLSDRKDWIRRCNELLDIMVKFLKRTTRTLHTYTFIKIWLRNQFLMLENIFGQLQLTKISKIEC